MKKITPVLVLTIFIVGVAWMIVGMKSAMDKVDPVKFKQAQSLNQSK